MLIRRRKYTFWLAAAAFFFFLQPVLPTVLQEPSGPILRVRTYSVVVDVVVTDGSNRPVRELTRDDFRVFEDGRPQEIISFEESRGEPAAAETAPTLMRAGEPRATTDETEAPPVVTHRQAPNFMILLLDHATVQYLNQSYIRDAAAEYIRNEMRPNDFMAVFQVGMSLQFVQGFTNDREALIRAVTQHDSTGSSYVFDQTGLAARADAAQDQVELLTTQINSITGSQAGFNSPDIAMVLEILNQQLELQQALEGTYYAQLSYSREQQSRPVIGAIETIARGVRHIPGRKTLVLFSEGFSVPLTLERPLYRAVDAANRANLAIYAIDGAGLQVKGVSTEGELHDISAMRGGDRVKAYGGLSQFDRAREIGSDQKDSTLRYLASATGGLLIRHTNDFLDALHRVDRDVRSHYVLTYQPDDLDFNGEFRNIRVEVDRPGVRVRARSGYWAVPPGASLLSAEEFRELVELSSGSDNRAETFEIDSRTFHFVSSPQDYEVYLAIETPLANFTPREAEKEVFVDLDITGMVTSVSGEVVTSFRGPSRPRLGSERGEETKFLRLESRFNLIPGQYALLLSVADPVSGRVAYQRRGLRLPAITQELSTSSLVLAKKSELLGATGEDVFTFKGMRLTPSAAGRFSRDDELIYYLNVYHPEADQAPPKLELELDLIRQGRFVTSEATTWTPSQDLRLARYLRLDELRSGDYVLRLTVRDPARAKAVSSQAKFVIQ